MFHHQAVVNNKIDQIKFLDSDHTTQICHNVKACQTGHKVSVHQDNQASITITRVNVLVNKADQSVTIQMHHDQ